MAVYYPISEYLDTFDSANAPSVPKPSLQQYDNYQIYSLVCCDYPCNRTYLRKSRISIVSGEYSSKNYFYYQTTKGFDDSRQFSFPSTGQSTTGIAYQQYSVTPISIDFSSIAAKLNIKPKDSYSYRHRTSTTTVNTFGDTLPNGAPLPVNIVDIYNVFPDGSSYDVSPYRYIQTDFESFEDGFTTGFRYKRTFTILEDISITVGGSPPQLDMFAAIAGYSADPRTKPDNYPRITPNQTGTLSISYYRHNPYEKVPGISSLDWYTHSLELQKGESINLPIINPVFGTLMFSGDSLLITDVKSQLSALESNGYHWSDYYVENIDSVIGQWKTIYNSFPISVPAPSNLDVFGLDYKIFDKPIQRVLAANNNHWSNDSKAYEDINFDPNHSLFRINNKRAYEWHILDQVNGSYGNLIMDSPRTTDIWYALNAGKYAVNELDSTKARVPTIGHLVEKMSSLLGYRPNANGEVDRVKEKSDLVRKQINKNDPSVAKGIQDGDYSPACFAKQGMIIKRLPNEIQNGRIVEGQIEKVHDIPQILASILDQLNESLGIQEGSNIYIPLSNKSKAIYPNQLALLIDMARTLAEINEYTRSTRITAMVTHQQVGEILAATGLEPIAKFVEVSSDGKTTAQIPYWGIHPKESLRTSIDNVTANVGILLGQIGV